MNLKSYVPVTGNKYVLEHALRHSMIRTGDFSTSSHLYFISRAVLKVSSKESVSSLVFQYDKFFCNWCISRYFGVVTVATASLSTSSSSSSAQTRKNKKIIVQSKIESWKVDGQVMHGYIQILCIPFLTLKTQNF